MTLPVLGRFGPAGRMIAIFLGGVLAALLALLVAVVVLEQSVSVPLAPAVPPTIPPSTSSSSPSIDPHAGDYEHDHHALDDEKLQWEPVVLGFAKNFTDTAGSSARQWRGRLTPYAAPAVRDQLVDVQLTKIPAGLYDSYELIETGNYQIAAKINYREGWALVVYVTSDGRGWKVTAYDMFEE